MIRESQLNLNAAEEWNGHPVKWEIDQLRRSSDVALCGPF